MGAKTGIAWTDASWNPIRGCRRVSAGCEHCYAEVVAARFNAPGQPYHGLATVKNGHAAWTGEVRFIEEHLTDPLRWRKPKRIFVNSMSDLFHERVSDEWLDRIFAVMALAPQHTFQCLTKRPERMLRYSGPAGGVARRDFVMAKIARFLETNHPPSFDWPLPNVHLGVSVEDQATADERIPLLLQTPAAVRWISAEPLLGPVSLRPFAPFIAHLGAAGIECEHGHDACPICDRGIDWVVVGGESGKGHRPMDLAWLEQIVQQCRASYVPVFVKQDSGSKAFARRLVSWLREGR